jgi:glycosyltransferase involved in cell wall biosynthesis
MTKASLPLVSILVPLYNNAGYIKWAIDSAVAQTYTNWEMIIVDDGSTDGSYELAKMLSNEESRIKVYRNNGNVGINKTRQVTVKYASGDFLAHLDSDDLLERWALETMVHEFEKHPEVMLMYSDFAQIDSKNKHEVYSASPDFDVKNLHQHGWRHFGMYRSAVLGHIQGFNDKISFIKTCEDGDLFMQIAEKFPILRVPKILYFYRNHGKNTSSQKPKCEECPANPDCNFIRVWARSLNYDQRTLKPL